MSVKKSVLLAAALLSAGIAGTAAKAEGSTAAKAEGAAETRYLELEQAIAAQERCTSRPFTQDQATALNQRVMTLVGTPLSAGVKLTLIETAKRNVNNIAATHGCADPQLAASRALFDRELAAAVSRY